jgi:hypothetical protein
MSFRIYKSIEGETTSKGGLLYRSKGCDGLSHVDEIDVIWKDAQGEVEYAETYAVQFMGRCDKSCTPNDWGFFLLCVTDKIKLLHAHEKIPVP